MTKNKFDVKIEADEDGYINVGTTRNGHQWFTFPVRKEDFKTFVDKINEFHNEQYVSMSPDQPPDKYCPSCMDVFTDGETRCLDCEIDLVDFIEKAKP